MGSNILDQIYATFKEYKILLNGTKSLRLTAKRYKLSVAFTRLIVKYHNDKDYLYISNLLRYNNLSIESIYLILKTVDKNRGKYSIKQIADFVLENGQGTRTRQLLNRLDKTLSERSKTHLEDVQARKMISEVIDDLKRLEGSDLSQCVDHCFNAVPLLAQIMGSVLASSLTPAKSIQIFTKLVEIIYLLVDDSYVISLTYKFRQRLSFQLMRLKRDHLLPLWFRLDDFDIDP